MGCARNLHFTLIADFRAKDLRALKVPKTDVRSISPKPQVSQKAEKPSVSIQSWRMRVEPVHIRYREQSSGAGFPANRSLIQSSTAWVLAWAAQLLPMLGIEKMRTLLPAPHGAAA
jgi:hypothetical protein